MHILLVAHQARQSGASRALIDIVDSLSGKCRFSVLLPEEGFVADELRSRKVEVYIAPLYRWTCEQNKKTFAKKICWKLSWKSRNDRQIDALAEKLRDKGIDLVHSNTSVIDYGEKLAQKLNVPHLWHIREYGEKDFDNVPLVKYNEYFSRFEESDGLLVCVSDGVAGKFRGKVDESKIRVVYDGVSNKHIIPDRKYKSEGPLILMQAGTINQFKGQKTAIEAIQILWNKGIKDIHLQIAGRGELSAIGLDESRLHNVELLGVVDDMPKRRAFTDVEIVSSRCEAFGLVIVEAMMGGNPVIASDSGGPKELIEEGESGLLFPQGDSKALAEKIEYLYNNRSEIERMGKNAAVRASSKFTLQQSADNIYKLYTELTKQGR